jgi:hypothetical protein
MSYGESEVGDVDLRWWREEDDLDCLLSSLWAAYDRVCRLESDRIQRHRRFRGMYGSRKFMIDAAAFGVGTGRIHLNGVRACVDKVTAKIGKQRPRPGPLTSGGNSTLVRKSRNLQRFLDAQFRRQDYYRLSPQIFRDAAITGTGLIYVMEDGRDVVYKRLTSEEVLVDPVEAEFGDPRTLYRRRWVSREVLCHQYPKHEEAIEHSEPCPVGDWLNPSEQTAPGDVSHDMVLLVEAFRLPSRKGARDGCRVVALHDVVLEVKEWKHSYFPVIPVYWTDPDDGFWGTGLAEELAPLQLEVNRVLQKIQAQMHLVSVARTFLPIGSKIQPAKMDNKVGVIIPFTGTQPPITVQPPGASPDMYAHLWQLWARMFEISGVNEMGTPDKTAMPTSQVGLQTRHDIETERFSIAARSYEGMTVKAAIQTIDRAKDLSKKIKNFAAPAARDKYSLDYVDWKEIDMAADEYEIGVNVTSALANDPAGRQAMVESMLNAGLISPDEGRVMLEFPDVERFSAMDRAASDLVDTLLERILDEGEFIPPEPFFDLDLALKKAQSTYNLAIIRRVPEDRLDMLRGWMRQCFELQSRAQVEAARVNAQAAGMNQQTMSPGAGTPPAPGVTGAPPMATTGG